MKKVTKILLSLVLVSVLVLGLAPSMNVEAANKGPNPNENGYPYILLLENEDTYTYIYAPTIEDVTVSTVKGISYNKKKNTLTIKNVKKPNARLVINTMGDDFKINVTGTNKLAGILSWGWDWGGNLYFTGTGSLELNKNRDLSCAIDIEAERTASCVKVAKTVTLKAYAGTKDGYSIYVGNESTLTKKSKAIIFENGASTKKVVMGEQSVLATQIVHVKINYDDGSVDEYLDNFYVLQKNGEYYVGVANEEGTYDMCYITSDKDEDGYYIAKWACEVDNLDEAGYSNIVEKTTKCFGYEGDLTLKAKKSKK